MTGPVTTVTRAPWMRIDRGNVLFVSDSETDTNIPDVLRADGHVVTVVTNDYEDGDNPTLQANLGAYHTVVWSATGDQGWGARHNWATYTNLTNYVASGG